VTRSKWLRWRRLFEERFGSLDMEIADLTSGSGAHVKIINLEERLRHR